MKIDKVEDLRDTGGRAWLVYDGPPDDKRPKIQIGSHRYTSKEATGCSVTVNNLTLKEHDALLAMLRGESYLRVVNGRLHAYHAYEELPDPVKDPIIAPHWVKLKDELVKYGNYPKENGWHSPGIIISYLGAGIGGRHFDNAETFKRNVEAVESCGFVCLRSKRLEEGTYDEKWVLHSLWSARGPLKEFLNQVEYRDAYWHAKADAACTFLAREMGIRFGTMDIVIQRWALTCGD